MGNVQAVSSVVPWEWKNEPPERIIGNEYDDAGYIPPGMMYAPQNSWGEARNYGGTPHMRGAVPGYTNLTWGATEGLLTSYGTINQPGGYPQLYDESQGQITSNMVDGHFVSVKAQPLPFADWRPGLCEESLCPLEVCTPDTFPNCDMTDMVEAGGEASFYDHKTQTAGRIYAESVNRAYSKAFISGGIEALTQVNTSEHSTFDPCSEPGLFELLLPLGAAVAGLGLYTYYGKPELTILAGTQTAEIGNVVVFGFVYNYSKGLLEYFNEPTNIHFERASRFLLYPLGLYAGFQAGNTLYAQTSQQANPQYFQIGGAFAGVAFTEKHLVMPVSKALASGSIIAELILGGFGALMRVVSGFWCRISTNQDSCTAMDKEEFQDSRRWDAVSIAAMLTLEACEREGWQKDSAEAQFVFRGLLSGPSMMTAPIEFVHNPTVFDQTLANPLGYTYAGRWQQGTNTAYWKEDPNAFAQYQRTGSIYGWDGDKAGWGNLANSNLYSCENWDIMREGLQQKQHPATQALKRKFDHWIGNWKDPGSPAGVLVAAAKNQANIEKMKHIPGWQLEDATGMYIPLKEAAQEIPGTNKPLDPPPPHEHEDLEVLPFYLDYPALTLGLQAPYKRLDIPPPHQKPPTLEVLPFVDVNDCAVTWRDDILSGNSRWAGYSAAQVQQSIERVLAAPNCSSCGVEDVGKLYALRIALGGSQSLTCAEFVAFLQHSGWSADVIQHAVYTVARTVDSGIPALAQWARDFVAECDNYEEPGTGFAALPASITSKWCT